MPRFAIAVTPLIALALSGCVARTLVDVATLPVRGAAQAADWVTTSEDEADRNRGREIREREERLGRLSRDYEDLVEECNEGNNEACREAVAVRQEMDELSRYIPADPPEDD